MMTRNKNRNFQLHEFFEEKIFIEDAWCAVCETADIGLFGPNEYEVLDKKFTQGICPTCGAHILSEIVEKYLL